MMYVTEEELDTRFTWHPPTEDQIPKYELMRSEARKLAGIIKELSPSSREQSLALTALDEVVFWTNSAIARRSKSE